MLSPLIPRQSGDIDRKECEYIEGNATNMLNDDTTNGLRFKLANEYKRMIGYAVREVSLVGHLST